MRLRYFDKALLLCLMAIVAVSCNDQWDEHFNPAIEGKSHMTSIEYIQSRDDLRIFAQMLAITGYDKILSGSQTHTVWAPNDASLSGIDLNNETLVRRIVQNHITQFSIASVGAKTAPYTMLNGKLLHFEKALNSYWFGGNVVQEADLAVKNGIVHVLGAYVPYQLNVLEFLNETQGLDSVRNYVQSLTKMLYDPQASFNSDGVFVDSIFVEYNPVLNYLCKMDSEDSTYTAIFPNNEAWTQRYEQVFPFFKTIASSGGLATQIAYSKWTIIQDLFFKSELSYPVVEDSAYVSTNFNEISNLNEILAGNESFSLSNGLAYITGSLKHKPSESWYKEIRVEAESIVGVDSLKSNYAVNYTTALGSGLNVSKQGYITAIPTTTSTISRLWVKFPIPNTLSAKYNIYCVFVPTVIADPNDLRPYKVNFLMTYRDAAGKIVKDKIIGATNRVTDPNQMTKMLVAENFEFPFSNLIRQSSDEDEIQEVTSVLLRVENTATTREAATFNRTIRIDCVILEPVE
jgi:hypothetical protein